jgi:hypothetical protein
MPNIERLSIDVTFEEHRQIKAYAALLGKTIREFVRESIRQRLERAKEEKMLSSMTSQPSLVLQELWDNEKDAAYDKL